MKEKIKKLAEETGLFDLYKVFRLKTDEMFSTHIECNIGDLMLRRDVPYENQILVASRLLDIEKYYLNEDKSFPFQNAIARARTGDENIVTGESFRSLLESVNSEGFRDDALFTCDNEFRLADGTHRLGVCLYLGISKINVKVLRRVIPYKYGGDWYFNIGLASKTLREIYGGFDEIQNKLIEGGNTFCCFASTPEVETINIVEDMKMMCNVLKINQVEGGGIIIQFSMMQPKYIISNNCLVSERAQEIERILKKRACGRATIVVSRNCTEGKQLYDKYIRHI